MPKLRLFLWHETRGVVIMTSIMRRNKLIVLILAFLVVFSFGKNSFAAEKPEEAKKIELFSGGEKFDDQRQYRLNQLKDIIKKAYEISAEKDPEVFKEQITQHLSASIQQEFSQNEIKQALNDFFGSEKFSVHKNTEEDLNELKEMLNEAKQKFDETDAVLIDPSKVKTIIINQEKSP